MVKAEVYKFIKRSMGKQSLSVHEKLLATASLLNYIYALSYKVVTVNLIVPTTYYLKLHVISLPGLIVTSRLTLYQATRI